MKRAAIVAVAIVGLGLVGTGVRGVAAVDGRLSDAADDPPAVRELENVRQEIRAPGDCPWSERRYEAPPRDELRL
jgi:hypothetical protein